MEKIFYRCEVCGNLVGLIEDGKIPMMCCGQKMTRLVPNTKDAALEKHVPSITLDGKNLHVEIGDVLHPMEEKHYIQWILVSQGTKTQRVSLAPGDKPIADFVLDSDTTPFIVYEYCNLHGLWEKKGFE